MIIDVRTDGTMVSVAFPGKPSWLAVIITMPVALVVASPVALIVVLVSSELVHVADPVRSWVLPSGYLPVVMNC